LMCSFVIFWPFVILSNIEGAVSKNAFDQDLLLEDNGGGSTFHMPSLVLKVFVLLIAPMPLYALPMSTNRCRGC
jgi:hypothetical protein